MVSQRVSIDLKFADRRIWALTNSVGKEFSFDETKWIEKEYSF